MKIRHPYLKNVEYEVDDSRVADWAAMGWIVPTTRKPKKTRAKGSSSAATEKPKEI